MATVDGLAPADATVDVLPASPDLSGAEIELAAPDRAVRLRAALAPLREAYDYVLVDCPRRWVC